MMTQQAILKKIVLAVMVFSIASMEAGNGTPRGRGAARGGKGGTRRFKPNNLPSRAPGNQSNQPSQVASTPSQQAPAASTPAVVPDVTNTQDFPSAGATVEQGERQATSSLIFGSMSDEALVAAINPEPAAQSTISPVSDTPQILAAEGETAHAVLVHFPSEQRISSDLVPVESIQAEQTEAASATVAPVVVPDIATPVSTVAATSAPENVALATNAAVEIAPASPVSEQPVPLISAPVEPVAPVPAPEVAQPTMKNTESPAVTVETPAAPSATVSVAAEPLPAGTSVLTTEITPAAFATPVAVVSVDSHSVGGLPETSSELPVAVAALEASAQATPVEVQTTGDFGAGVMPLFNNQNSETPASLSASVSVMVEQSSAAPSEASAVSVNSTRAIEVPASDSGAPASSAVSTTPEIAGQRAGVEAAQPATVVAPAASDTATSDALAGGVAGSQTVPTKLAPNATKTQTLNSQGQGFFPGLSPRTYAIFASLVVGVPVLIKYGLTPVYRWVFPPEEQEEEEPSKKSLRTSDFGNQS